MITKKDKKEISRLIKDLPPMVSKEEKVKVTVSGRLLIENNVLKLSNGSEVNPNKIYLTERPKPINHKTNAEKEFKKGGMIAVQVYIAMINEILYNQQNKVEETA